MRALLIFATILGLGFHAYGLKCYKCQDGDYDGELGSTGSCFKTDSSTHSEDCKSGQYCRTHFTIEDSVATAVERECIAGEYDEYKHDKEIPDSNKCETVIDDDGNPTDKTNCFYHCAGEKCNTVTQKSLTPCKTTCNRPKGGFCNYITGKCVCNPQYSGPNCETWTVIARKCVQCNSLTEEECGTNTKATFCPAKDEKYCTVGKTTIYDNTDKIIRTVITRGCTNKWTDVDDCRFTNIHTDHGINSTTTGYNEFTCYSTCNMDGCNTNTPDGVLNNGETIPVQCIQCKASWADCAEPKDYCGPGETYCSSTVVYVVYKKTHGIQDKESPTSYKLLTTERKCAKEPVEPTCKVSKIGELNFEKVTCTETCEGENCNDGWPARPKCAQCNGKVAFDGTVTNQACVDDPSLKSCKHPFFSYCTTDEKHISEGPEQKKKRESLNDLSTYQKNAKHLVRGCGYLPVKVGCNSTVENGLNVRTCKQTCATDGCNAAIGVPKINLVAFALLLIGTTFNGM